MIRDRLIREHELDDRESVKDCYGDQIPLVQLGLLVQDHGTLLGQISDGDECLGPKDVLVLFRILHEVDLRLVEGRVLRDCVNAV